MNAQKRDANEPEIIEFLRGVGTRVQQMDKSDGFDLLVTCGLHYIVEVKNPARKWALTEAEQKTKDEIESAGGRYYVVTSVEDAARVIGWEIT
jgi:hypothetical protein